jgi:hypothetical protein
MARGSRWLPKGSPFTFERFDQGEDFRSTPGGHIVAPWAGTLKLAPPNPGGFGTHYGIFTPSEGPYAGQEFYIGHAYAAPTGHKQAGQALATLGRGWESWMGNARGIPGHTEIGKWPPGSMSSGVGVKNIVEGEGTGDVAHWKPCILTWYDPALGGKNSSHGQADPHARTASGEPYNASAFTCAAPDKYAFGTHITFKHRGKIVACRVNDRGGAITGNHFDLSRAAAEKIGIIGAGRVMGQFSVGNVATSSGPGRTRPGGTGVEDDAALASAFALNYADDSSGTGPHTEETVFLGGSTGGSTENVLYFPGLGPIPLKNKHGDPAIPVPGIADPLQMFKDVEGAVKSGVDFLKWIAWLFHPRNILRVVEFVTGLTIMAAGLHTAVEAHRGGGASGRRARSRRRRERVVRVARTVAK